MRTTEGQTFPPFFEFWNRLLSVANSGQEALWRIRVSRRSHDPFAFLGQPSSSPAAPGRTNLDQCVQYRRRVDELVSKLYVDRPRHLDPELAEVFQAVAVGFRECSRLIECIPCLWADEDEYGRLAAGVADAATAALNAHRTVDIRLRRTGGPNPVLDTLNKVLTVKSLAPLDLTGVPGRLDAVLPKLFTKRGDLFPHVDGKDCIDRMLDQLAQVPPISDMTRATDSLGSVSGALPLGTERDEGGVPIDDPEGRKAFDFGVFGKLPTSKIPGVMSLSVLRVHLEMLGHPEWRQRMDSWLEVPFLRVKCAELFPGQPFSSGTIETLIAWFQVHGLTPDQARHLPLTEAVRRLQQEPTPVTKPQSVSGPTHSQSGAAGEHTARKERRKRTRSAEAEVLVRDWLGKNAKENPTSVTRDAIAAGTGISTGQVSKTAGWQAFSKRRNAKRKPSVREVPLTDAMKAIVPSDCAKPDELAALIEEQEADSAEQDRRHKRRHEPS